MTEGKGTPEPTVFNRLYFDDLEVGMEWASARRTITEADVAAFAGLSGDFNPLHVDEVAASSGAYGRRLVYGILVLAIASGLRQQMGIFAGSMKAMMELRSLRFLAPVFIGDTVMAVTRVAEMRETSKPGQGIVVQDVEILNQDGEIVQSGEFVSLMASRPSAEARG